MLLNRLLEEAAKQWPQKIACVCGERRLTYVQLNEQADYFAHYLIKTGIQQGDRVAIQLENRLETIIALLGVLKAGAVFIVINPTTKPGKLNYLLKDCDVSAVVLSSRVISQKEQILQDVGPLRAMIVVGHESDSHESWLSTMKEYVETLQVNRGVTPKPFLSDQNIAAIIYTSGSTGQSKGVVMTHRNLLSATRSINQYLENTNEDIILSVLPLSFTYGLSQLFIALYAGATLVLERSFAYPYDTIKRIQTMAVTAFPGVPTIFATLLGMNDIDPETFRSVRYITNAGAALPPSHLERLSRLFKNAKIFSMYGQTECIRASYLPPEEIRKRPTSVGRGMPNQEWRVVDDAGHDVQPGQPGELVIRGSHVMAGYWKRPEETARALRPGPYPWEKVLYTGDLFTVDEEGYLYFVARTDNVIKSRGEKVSPREIENVLYEMKQIQQAVVIGVPDPILGQAIKAIIVKRADEQLTAKEVITHCAQRLESYMIPKVVDFWDSLPMTDNGKIHYDKLYTSHSLQEKDV